MTRSLEGKVFYENRNNGVFAIVSQEVQLDRARFDSIRTRLTRNGVADGPKFDAALIEAVPLQRMPIFTFAGGVARYEVSPWFTGNEPIFWALREHILGAGGQLYEHSIFVPFSNGTEMGHAGLEAQCRELKYVTTDEQFIQTFGIALKDLVNKK